MALKKNYHQITFLHIYHHVTIFPIWWAIVYFAPGGEGLCMCRHSSLFFYSHPFWCDQRTFLRLSTHSCTWSCTATTCGALSLARTRYALPLVVITRAYMSCV